MSHSFCKVLYPNYIVLLAVMEQYIDDLEQDISNKITLSSVHSIALIGFVRAIKKIPNQLKKKRITPTFYNPSTCLISFNTTDFFLSIFIKI